MIVSPLCNGLASEPLNWIPCRQCAQCFENLAAILNNGGMGWEDCVKLVVYFAPGCDISTVRAARAKALGDVCVAATGLGVEQITDEYGDEALVQIELVAAKCGPVALL